MILLIFLATVKISYDFLKTYLLQRYTIDTFLYFIRGSLTTLKTAPSNTGEKRECYLLLCIYFLRLCRSGWLNGEFLLSHVT